MNIYPRRKSLADDFFMGMHNGKRTLFVVGKQDMDKIEQRAKGEQTKLLYFINSPETMHGYIKQLSDRWPDYIVTHEISVDELTNYPPECMCSEYLDKVVVINRKLYQPKNLSFKYEDEGRVIVVDASVHIDESI